MAIDASLTFGQLLRRFRKSAGLTQEVLAEQAGISARTISDLERGLYQHPHWDTVQLLADALGLTPEDRRILESASGRGEEADSTLRKATKQQELRLLTSKTVSIPGKGSSAGRSIIAFLIADIRGYTRFTEQRGDEAAAELTLGLVRLVEEVVRSWEGRVVETRGDEVLIAFASARNALRAAVSLQARLDEARATDPAFQLEVGIGIDAGEAVQVEEGYRGGALNLAARLCALAAGGEVFATEGIIHLARQTDDLVYVDRGDVPVKGFRSQVRVIQVAAEGTLPDTLPPLHATPVNHPNNLPDEPTPFIGREREIEVLAQLLTQPTVRLVTLTGTGGSGKTRLALRVGNALLQTFRDGVFFVSLGSLTDPALVPSAVAKVLGIQEAGGTDLLSTLVALLQEKHLLLMLDNFEHLLDAATFVSSLLDACRNLHILVTSRTPLRLLREHEYLVPSLAVPESSQRLNPDQVARYSAVALFIERARAVRPAFCLTSDNSHTVAEICRRLDGLPLAIELAATRMRLFSPQALLQRLSHRLSLLTGGERDRPARHQTLRNTIDWSFSLLTPEEQTLFARLSVFGGGCTFEAADSVCNPDGDVDILEGLQSLVGKNIVREERVRRLPADIAGRFRMLDTIREYAVEQLQARDEKERLGCLHAEYFLRLVQEGGQKAFGQRQVERYHLLEAELDNLRAATDWARDQSRPELGLRIIVSTTFFWVDHGRLLELQQRVDVLLNSDGHVDPSVRVQALEVAGIVRLFRMDVAQGMKFMEEALALAREVDDPILVAQELSALGTAQFSAARLERAEALQQEALRLSQETGNLPGEAFALFNLAMVAAVGGDLKGARILGEEGLRIYRQLGDVMFITIAILNLGQVAIRQGELERAAVLLLEGLGVAESYESVRSLVYGVELVAALGGARGDVAFAAQLLGAAEVLRTQTGESIGPDDSLLIEHTIKVALDRMGEAEWNGVKAEGQELTLREAVELARKYASG